MAALAAGQRLMQQRLSLQRRPLAAAAVRPSLLAQQRTVSVWLASSCQQCSVAGSAGVAVMLRDALHSACMCTAEPCSTMSLSRVYRYKRAAPTATSCGSSALQASAFSGIQPADAAHTDAQQSHAIAMPYSHAAKQHLAAAAFSMAQQTVFCCVLSRGPVATLSCKSSQGCWHPIAAQFASVAMPTCNTAGC